MDSKNNNIIKVIDFGTSQKYQTGEKMDQTYGTAYYIAPEVLSGEYNEKCDVWSIGVILYILLSGRPPFDGPDDRSIIKKVSLGHFDFKGKEWKKISTEAQDFIASMLEFDPDKRITATAALNHAWIKDKAKIQEADGAIQLSALQNLQSFRAEQKLQQAAITFIVSQLASKEEMNEL